MTYAVAEHHDPPNKAPSSGMTLTIRSRAEPYAKGRRSPERQTEQSSSKESRVFGQFVLGNGKLNAEVS